MPWPGVRPRRRRRRRRRPTSPAITKLCSRPRDLFDVTWSHSGSQHTHPGSVLRSSQDDGGSSRSHVTEYRIPNRPPSSLNCSHRFTVLPATSHLVSIASARGCCCGSCYQADLVHEMVATAAGVSGLPEMWVLICHFTPLATLLIMQDAESSCTSLFLLARFSLPLSSSKQKVLYDSRVQKLINLRFGNQARRAHAAPSDSAIPRSAGVTRIASCSRMRPQKSDLLPRALEKKVTAFECNSLHGHPFFPLALRSISGLPHRLPLCIPSNLVREKWCKFNVDISTSSLLPLPSLHLSYPVIPQSACLSVFPCSNHR